MTNQYTAVTRIEIGTGNGERRIIEPGEVVDGLTKDQMVELWNAGVLTEKDDAADKKADERDDKIAALEQELATMRAEKAAAAVPQGDAPDATPEEIKASSDAKAAEEKASSDATPEEIKASSDAKAAADKAAATAATPVKPVP